MKRILPILLICVVLATCFVVPVFASTTDSVPVSDVGWIAVLISHSYTSNYTLPIVTFMSGGGQSIATPQVIAISASDCLALYKFDSTWATSHTYVQVGVSINGVSTSDFTVLQDWYPDPSTRKLSYAGLTVNNGQCILENVAVGHFYYARFYDDAGTDQAFIQPFFMWSPESSPSSISNLQTKIQKVAGSTLTYLGTFTFDGPGGVDLVYRQMSTAIWYRSSISFTGSDEAEYSFTCSTDSSFSGTPVLENGVYYYRGSGSAGSDTIANLSTQSVYGSKYYNKYSLTAVVPDPPQPPPFYQPFLDFHTDVFGHMFGYMEELSTTYYEPFVFIVGMLSLCAAIIVGVHVVRRFFI